MIKAIGLTKIFRTESVQTIALNEISIDISEGEFVAIMGPLRMWQIDLAEYTGTIGQSDFR